MRITYRTLRELLNHLSPEQLDADVTVEISYDQECYPAELRIAGPNHDSLDENHPVLFIGLQDSDVRRDDIHQILVDIGLISA